MHWPLAKLERHKKVPICTGVRTARFFEIGPKKKGGIWSSNNPLIASKLVSLIMTAFSGHFLCGRVLPNEISVISILLQSLLARS